MTIKVPIWGCGKLETFDRERLIPIEMMCFSENSDTLCP
jgi:hypothetical protein